MTDTSPVAYDEAYRLAVCRPAGVLDPPQAATILDFVLALEATHPGPFDRLLDLTAVAEVRLSGEEVYRIAQARRASAARRRPFRTAILAPSPIAYGMGRMYEVLMEGSAVRASVFRNAAAAAAWLGVPTEVVEPPAAGEP